MRQHPYWYALAVVVVGVAVLALALASISGDRSTFSFWFGYKVMLWGPIVLGLTWWGQRRAGRGAGPG